MKIVTTRLLGRALTFPRREQYWFENRVAENPQCLPTILMLLKSLSKAEVKAQNIFCDISNRSKWKCEWKYRLWIFHHLEREEKASCVHQVWGWASHQNASLERNWHASTTLLLVHQFYTTEALWHKRSVTYMILYASTFAHLRHPDAGTFGWASVHQLFHPVQPT